MSVCFCRYLHSDVPQYTDPSSLHRLSQVKELPQPTNSTDILALLGDTADTEYPIYRTATGPDSAATLATGKSLIFGIVLLKGVVYVHYYDVRVHVDVYFNVILITA